MRAGAGDADVQQPAFLGNLLVGLGLADGQHPLLHRRQEDGVPLEPLRPVVGEQVDADALCRVLCGVAAVEVGQQVRGTGGRICRDKVRGDRQQQVERRRAFAGLLPDRVGTRLVAQAPDEQVAHGVNQPGTGLLEARTAEQLPRLANLAALVEALATDGVLDARPGQRVLDRRQLGVDAHEDGDLRLGHAAADQPADAGDEGVDLDLGAGVAVDRGLGAGGSGGRQRAARAIGCQSVGESEDLRG